MGRMPRTAQFPASSADNTCMATVDPAGPPRTSWRVGDRTVLPDGVEVGWRLPPRHQAGRKRSRQRGTPESATVTDVSDGGAAIIVAQASEDLKVGSEVVVGLEDSRATVQIVRFEDLDGGRRRYGVRFVRVGAGFREALLRHRGTAPVVPGRPPLPSAPGAAPPGGPHLPPAPGAGSAPAEASPLPPAPGADIWRNSH